MKPNSVLRIATFLPRRSHQRLLKSLLLFAVTWMIIPFLCITSSCIGFQSHAGSILRGLVVTEFLYFLPGLVLALLFFSCLRLSLRWFGEPRGWAWPLLIVSFLLSVFEAVICIGIANGSVLSNWSATMKIYMGSLAGGLFVSSALSGAYWLRWPGRRGGR